MFGFAGAPKHTTILQHFKAGRTVFTMDVSDITPQLDQLEEQLNKAQEVLGPLLGDIGDISGKLPLLDKAKLYVLVSYTIESLLFCKTSLIRPFNNY